MNCLPRWIVAALALCGALILASCDGPITASRLDPAFGVNGTLTVPVDYGGLTVVPLPDGGLLTQVYGREDAPLERRTSTGAKAPGWTEPRPGRGQVIGGFTDGSVLVATKRTTNEVIARYGRTGAPMADLGIPSRPGRPHSYAISGDQVLASTTCDEAGAACDIATVDEFRLDGTVTRRSVAFGNLPGIGGTPCSAGSSAISARRVDDGSTLVAIAWCSSTNDDPSVVIRRLTPAGTVDPTYGGGAGFATFTGYPVNVPMNSTGQVAMMTTTTLRRLTPSGVPDTTFGTFTLPPTFEGVGMPNLSIVSNGSGYTLAQKTDGRSSGEAPASVTHLGPDGKTVGPVASFAADVFPSLVRYPDGSLLAVSQVRSSTATVAVQVTKLVP